MRFELLYNGTPCQFARRALDFAISKLDGDKWSHLFVEWPQCETCKPDADYTAILIHSPETLCPPEYRHPASVTADLQPGGQTRLIVEAEDADWPDLAEWWELLHAEMKRQNLLADVPTLAINVSDSIGSRDSTSPGGNAVGGQGEPSAKSAQAKFTLPTTPDRFTTWLENHTQAVNTQVGGWWGGYTLQPARRMVRTDKRNVWRIAAVSEDADIEDAISFEIEDTSPERIKVTAKCIFGVPSPVYKYFFGLLVDIGDERGWSEAREGINRAFGVTDEIPQTTPGAAPDALTSPTSGVALGSRKGKEERTIDKPTTGYLEWLRQNIG